MCYTVGPCWLSVLNPYHFNTCSFVTWFFLPLWKLWGSSLYPQSFKRHCIVPWWVCFFLNSFCWFISTQTLTGMLCFDLPSGSLYSSVCFPSCWALSLACSMRKSQVADSWVISYMKLVLPMPCPVVTEIRSVVTELQGTITGSRCEWSPWNCSEYNLHGQTQQS